MIWAKTAALLMFIGVALGAFGSHALRDKITESRMDMYKTAIFYHFIHAIGLFVIAWLSAHIIDPKITTGGIYLVLGIALFSGSLYLLVMTNWRWLGFITPLGGLSFLIGWAYIFLALKTNIN